MILLNNRIYGLTKGQYSPTSPRGFVSKSSPFGTTEDPFRPAELCFGARGNFFARSVASDNNETIAILKAAYQHKGAAVCEILQNCVIFNDNCHNSVYTSQGRKENAIYVKHGEPLVFGPNQEYGLSAEWFGLKVVKIGEDGVKKEDILVHDAHCQDNTLQLKLAMMSNEDGFPIALGVIRDVEAPTYDAAVNQQIEEVKAQKHYHTSWKCWKPTIYGRWFKVLRFYKDIRSIRKFIMRKSVPVLVQQELGTLFFWAYASLWAYTYLS